MNLSKLNPYKIPIIAGSAVLSASALYFGISRQEVKPDLSPNKPTAAQPAPTEIDLKIRGNKSSRIYHLPNCPNYSDIAERNVVNFKTTEEAESKGFRMAKNCR